MSQPVCCPVPLPNPAPTFVRTDDARRREVFHSFSRTTCPTCHALVDGARVIRDGKVYLRRQCPEHGRAEALISGDAEWFLRSLQYVVKGSVPLKHSTEVKDGCPKDCGLCPDHEQHSCLPIIEITNHCNLECPICIVQNRHNYAMSRAEFSAIIDGLVEKEGWLDTVNLSGGEPTIHPEFLEFLDIAKRPEISRVSVSTNGLRCAAEPAFCEELARRGVYVNLQLDAMSAPELRVLRGNGDHRAMKEKALENLERAGCRTTIVSTVAKGVNDHTIGEAVKLLLEKDFILSLMFQPAAYTGYGGAHFGPHDPMNVITIPDVVHAIEAQTVGALRADDFLPLPCSHPSCFGLTYLLKTDEGFVPFPRFVEIERYLDLIQNRGTIRPDVELEGTMRAAIDTLWTSADQVPDSGRILRALKQALRTMYPEERVLALEERLRLGEGMVKTIFMHAFMDVHTFEVDRIKKCCTHYALPDGRLMPGCAYNLFYRDKDPRYAGAVGSARIWAAPRAPAQGEVRTLPVVGG
ncbi:MAG: radical SAM protein [Planctomycetes bacterium]|nr:radical SAM protein [Planctomycetota bacterium]